MGTLCRALTLLVAVMISLLPQAVQAAERPIGLGPVQYDGEFPPYFRSEIEQTITAAIEQAHGSAVVLGGPECMELGCVRGDARRSDIAVVILSRAYEADRDYRMEIVAYAVANKRVLARSVIECNICGQRELLNAIPAKLVALHADIAVTLAAQAKPDADTPWALTGARSHRAMRIGGWATLSLGLAGVGTGAVLWAIDGRDYKLDCGPSRVDANGACPDVYTTAIAGQVAVGLGIAAIAVGTGLLLHQRHARSRVQLTATGLELRF